MAGLRVVGGAARGRRLKLVPGETTRPIMDRVKENLFNILGPTYVADQVWLDLFAGTGQVGIEALSRGARLAIFLDTARAAIDTIHENLRLTALAARAQVYQTDAFAFLRQTRLLFDVIFVAPPQYKGLWRDALDAIDRRAEELLAADGLVVVQIDPREEEEWTLRRLELVDQRRYGNTLLCFYARRAPADDLTPDEPAAGATG